MILIREGSSRLLRALRKEGTPHRRPLPRLMHPRCGPNPEEMSGMPEDISKLYGSCTLCPRSCKADRNIRAGFCKAGVKPRLAKAMIHIWEEPVLCESGGSGAVFFSNCTLRCVYCQNYEISAKGFGREITPADLADIFLSLEQKGAQNIDLITASHYLPSVLEALDMVRHKIKIPFVYNCGGYESVKSLRLLSGYIDIYLPDIKYYDDAPAVKYSFAPHYFETACEALEEMIRQTGAPVIEKAGGADAMKKGVIVRHMVLPSHKNDSLAVLENLYRIFGPDKFILSLLRQYTPFYLAKTSPEFKEINRRVTGYEYDAAADEAARLGFKGFIQEKSSAKEEYTPVFDLEGIPGGITIPAL